MKRRGGRKSHRPGAGERLGGGVKRRAEPGMPSEATSSGVPPSMAAAAAAEGGAGMEPDELEFEDPFIDEEDADEDGQVIEEDHVFADDPDKLNIDLSEGTDGAVVKVFRPGIDVVPEGDKLEYSAEAYVMYHAMSADWPCLSVDVVPDLLGMARTKMPLTTFFVAGTQADTPKNNSLLVLKASNLVRTQHDEDEDVVDLDEEDDPVLEIQSIPHYGGINRVRVMPQ
ncbi:grwd1, partial [Symbiodinium sp. KB8]